MAEGKRSYAYNADNPFSSWLELQLELQRDVFVDPRIFSEDEEGRAEFMTWNHSAAIIELGEAMQEVGWKPWASSRHLNDAAFLAEIVDALHFIGNMVLAAAESRRESPHELAQKLWSEYQNKVQKNIQRQLDGYDGVSTKCPKCKRELVIVTVGSGTSPDDGISSIQCPVHGKVI